MPEFVLDEEPAGLAKIKVVGVGGGGCNAVDAMFNTGIQNVDFYVVNSDLQALKRAKCPNRIQIGAELTSGRGCGADPRLGEQCMVDARDMMTDTLTGADIVFVTAGLGGGTGTGAAPVVAQIAKDLGILTVSVVTRPFKFEGPRRMRSADGGLEKLREASDTMIVINNERLLEVAGPKVPMRDAFAIADKVLSQAVQSISDLVATPGLINVDFNDIRTIMGGRGGAVMGVGVGKGESRASEAVKKATNSPLLDKVVIDGATGVLICITGGPDMTLSEVSEATELVAQAADPDAEIIFGAVIDDSMSDMMRVTLIATGFNDELHRRRELEEAARSAPVRGTIRRGAPAPAPAAAARMRAVEPQPEPAGESLVEALGNSPIFNDEGCEAPPKAASRRPEPAKSSLRASLDEMLGEDEQDAPAPAPQIKVASSAKTNGGSHPAVRPANQPAAAPAARAAVAEAPAPNVPQYNGAESKKKAEAYDTPAFMRRRRSLFD